MSATRSRATTKCLVFGFAALASVLSTACQNGRGGGGGAPAPVVTQASPTPVPLLKKKVPGTPELDGESSQSSQLPPPPRGYEEPVRLETVPYDPTGLKPQEVYAYSERAPQPTEGNVPSNIEHEDGSLLVYSGSGLDDLREIFHSLVNSNENPEQSAIDARFASGVSLSNYSVDTKTNRVSGIVMVQRDGRSVHMSFQGYLDRKGSLRTGDLRAQPKIELELNCMDRIDSCHTAHIRVRDGSEQNVKTAHIIARQTSSNLHIEGPGAGMAKNDNYDRLLNILRNTIDYPKGVDRVSKINFVTSETVNGPAVFSINMELLLLGRQGRLYTENLAFMGALVKPINSFDLGLNGHEIEVVQTNSRLSRMLSQVRLMRNDGRGNLTLALTVGQTNSLSRAETVHIILARKHTPVRQPSRL